MAVDLIDIEAIDQAKSHMSSFMLWPEKWNAFNVDTSNYTWHEFRFKKTSLARVPDQMGVYTFVIKPNIAKHYGGTRQVSA
jgi:hypothetical protein